MKIVIGWPPNIKKIKKILTPAEGMVFTYGDTIYNPSGAYVADHLQIHEQVHMAQQKKPETWWNKYLIDPRFRLEQELEAYRAQYKFAEKAIKDRNQRARFLHAIASDLASKSYGGIISYLEAIEGITKK